MNETQVTLVGNIVTDPVLRITRDGVPVGTFRLASSTRRFDRNVGEWKDLDSLFLTVNCWRRLAEHVATSVRKGDGVLVVGRLLMRSFETKEGEKRSVFEVEATAVGPDLNRGTAQLVRPGRAAGVGVEPRSERPIGGDAGRLTGEAVGPEPSAEEPVHGPAAGSFEDPMEPLADAEPACSDAGIVDPMTELLSAPAG